MPARVFSIRLAIVLAFVAPLLVVVAMFEPGEDTGDRPGEFQFWVEREKLTRTWPFPQGYLSLRTAR